MATYTPQAAFRSWIGVAKDQNNAYLQIAHTATGTTLTLRSITQSGTALTASGATYSAIIVDGPNTETVGCSGNLTGTTDGSTIAVAALANNHSANAYVYFQLTASLGPTAGVRATKIEFSDAYDNKLYDTAFRGSQAAQFGAQQGLRWSNFVLEGTLFADEFGYILEAFFGAYDYTAGPPVVYAFSPLNTGNGQPASYLFYDYNPGGATTRVFSKAVLSDLTIKFEPGALTTWTATGRAFASGVVTTPSVPTFSTFTPVAAWNGSVTVGGTITPSFESAEFVFKREQFKEVPTLQGIQDPLIPGFSGPVSLNVKCSVVQPGNETLLNNYINISQPTFDLKANKGTGTGVNGLEIHCNVANFEDLKVVQTGKSFVTLDLPFTALANTSDASTAGGGYSPAKLTLTTGTAGTSTQY